MSGFDNEVLYAQNVDFTNSFPVSGQMNLNGELLVGATVSPFIRSHVPIGTNGLVVTTGPGTIDFSLAAIPNSAIAFPFVTVTAGSGLTGGGTVSLGGTITLSATGGSGVSTLTGDSGTATPTAGNIQIAGGDGIVTSASGAILTISNDLALGRFPITAFVVGPIGLAGYQTIQSALDAATAVGGGVVYIMPSASPYTEDLILYDNVSIVSVSGNSDVPSAGNTTTIVGSHTPPASGYVSFRNCYLMHASAIFFSAGSGTAQIVLCNCVTEVTTGYVFDMLNWVAPGAFIGFNSNSVQGVNSAWINNTGQATTYIQDSIVGSGNGTTMIISGILTLKNVDFYCPLELRKNIISNIDNCRFGETVTATINATGIINFSRFDPLTNGPAFVMNSTDPIRLSNCLFNTPNNPCIDGTGGGLLTLTSATFIDNAIIAGTVNVAAASAFLPASFGTTGQVFTSNGPGVVPSFQAAATGGTALLITKFTASGTWTKSTSPVTRAIQIIAWGGGAGGGSGRKGASSSTKTGGAGGGGGQLVNYFFPDPSVFSSSETVTIGGTAAGGTSQTTNSTNGNPGTVGNDTSISTKIVAKGGNLGAGGGTAGGGTVTTDARATIFNGSISLYSATQAGNGGAGGTNNSVSGTNGVVFLGALGGGGGGGVTSGNALGSGSAGGTNYLSDFTTVKVAGGTAGASPGGAAGNGSNAVIDYYYYGASGGGGGGGAISVNGGAGGNGGTPGGGGGGGGAAENSLGNSGAGGIGARGELWVIEYFG